MIDLRPDDHARIRRVFLYMDERAPVAPDFEAVTDEVHQLTPGVSRNRQRRRRGPLVMVGAALAVLVLFGIGLLVSNLPIGGSELASDPGAEPAYSYTLDLPSWQLAGAWEAPDGSGTSHTLFDRIVDDAPRRVTIESGSTAIDRADTIEDLKITPTMRISLGGEEAIAYDTSEIYENEEEAALVSWATAVVTWTDPSEETAVVFLFEGIDVDEATSLLLSHLKPVSPDEWQAMVTSYFPPVTTVTGEHPERALMASAVPIAPEDIHTEDLKDVMAVEETDQLLAIPVGDHQVLARFREGSRPHLYATSCDVLAQVDLPEGWEGTCLERTIDGQRVSGVFEYGDTSSSRSPKP